ncbi:CLUMA_CG007816, isoform A [Clunio marinus]|uniref:CLUMA_CG007816, isoform A n=1 Tax=Clunio marinus TaxID=568069 RepID=A0A1J1I1Y5_9DIPT|nr:CLUMA_CG007816, isoform A [Clunio marinus]
MASSEWHTHVHAIPQNLNHSDFIFLSMFFQYLTSTMFDETTWLPLSVPQQQATLENRDDSMYKDGKLRGKYSGN